MERGALRQKLIITNGEYGEFDQWLCGEGGFLREGGGATLLVCGKSFRSLPVRRYFEGLGRRPGVKLVMFDGFEPNPLYGSVVKGAKVFHSNGCRSIIAVGGGSAIDVAKCIKLYVEGNLADKGGDPAAVPGPVKLAAIPTTAGSGSEATRFAVVYRDGEKQSVMDDGCVPSLVLLDGSALKTLPEYQRKATMLDALCHGVESFWSVNSTKESREYSRKAIRTVMENREGYLANQEEGNANMLLGAHWAGKAIHIAQTTAGHAMSYKLTGLYGIAHGHGAALCVSRIWPYMLSHREKWADPRGEGHLDSVFEEIASAMGCTGGLEGAALFGEILRDLCLGAPVPKEGDFGLLKKSVNPVRLKNSPVELDEEVFDSLYRQMLAH